MKPLRAGVKLMNTTSGNDIGGSLKVCSLNDDIKWLNTLISSVNSSQKKTRMLSGRAAAESHLCVMSPNKWSDQNEYVTYLNLDSNAVERRLHFQRGSTYQPIEQLVIRIEPSDSAQSYQFCIGA